MSFIRTAVNRNRVDLVLRYLAFGLFFFLALGFPGHCPADEITVSGRVEMIVDCGNGLTRYYLVTPDIKYRIWVHILDPKKNQKERLLESAARDGGEVSVTGAPDVKNKEKILRATKILPR